MDARRASRVLVVDDQPAVLEAAGSVLRQQGYQVFAVGTTEVALALLGRVDPHLVVVDLAMQRADRGALLEELRRCPPQTVAVILTGEPSEVSIVDVIREGAYHYLVKPFDPELLRAVAAHAIERTVLARGTRELVEDLDAANAQLRELSQQLQRRVDEATDQQRRKVRQLSQAKRKLEEAQRQRQRFISTVAHDLGAPLTALEGYAALLGDPNASTDVRERARRTIAAEARRLARLVEDLADAEQVAAGRFRLRPARCDLAGIAREQVELARARTDRHTFELDVPRTAVVAACDPDRVGQVLSNLLTNAVKHTPGGTIRVALAIEPGAARFSVADQGPGIPHEFRRRIFRPGLRLPRDADGSEPEGAGLGLYIVKALVEAHRGRIWVEDGHPGATFVVRLPLRPARSARPPDRKPPRQPRSRRPGAGAQRVAAVPRAPTSR